jgi:hypothetical protein
LGRGAPFFIYRKNLPGKWGTKFRNLNPLLTRVLKGNFFLVLFLLNFYPSPAEKLAQQSLYIQELDPIYSKEAGIPV